MLERTVSEQLIDQGHECAFEPAKTIHEAD